MIIRTQNSLDIFDLDKALSISATEAGAVVLISYAGEALYYLGEYESQNRAKEVVEEIFSFIGIQEKYDMPVV